MSKFDLDVLHQTISDTQSNICQAVIVKEGKLIYADTWNGYSINDTVHIASATWKYGNYSNDYYDNCSSWIYWMLLIGMRIGKVGGLRWENIEMCHCHF